jgi:hypothetical protein
MTDEPGQDDTPAEDAVAFLSEPAMWITWLNELNLSAWDPIYRDLDFSARQEEKINREGGGIGETYPDDVQRVEDLEPINVRMRALPGAWAQVRRHTAKLFLQSPGKQRRSTIPTSAS